MQNIVKFTALALVLALVAGVAAPPMFQFDAAWAQDDDDGDDDDGGDDDDAGDGGRDRGDDRRPTRSAPAAPARAAPAPAPAPVPLPAFAPDEIVTLALDEADLATLIARGYTVIEERPVPEVGIIARRLSIPRDTTLDAARDEVRGLATGADADFNHYYRTEQADDLGACEGPHCASLDLIGWVAAPAPSATCAADIAIGVIDTGINPDHTTFAAARLDVHRVAPEDLDPSRAIHGTAVVAILVGSPESRSPGLLPEAQVIAVDAFHRRSGDERADVFALAAAMDYLAQRDTRIVNMSLAGPPNTVLQRAVAEMVAQDILIVAAAGNAGPRAEPAYPAAYPGVVAVTAVDREGQIYRRAVQGPHVELAAPGVEVWTAASIRGARPKTGTSFAAPFVTAAAAALLAADPSLTREDLRDRLTAGARDLGAPGRDPIYGHGLVQAAPLCSVPG